MAQRLAKRANWAGLALAALLGGCVGPKPPASVSCPKILVLDDAHRFTQFRQGGHDVTDIVAEGELSSYKGSCQKTADGIEVEVALAFDLTRGPANKNGQVAFSYFVAMPAFYPDPKAKAVLPVHVAFPDNATSMHYVDEDVTLTVPAKDGAPLPDIFIGFQLDNAQLRYNRQRSH